MPALAATALRAADALGMQRFDLGAHDIGGGVAQHRVLHGGDRVRRLVLVNSVQPYRSQARVRSWSAMAAEAEPRCTLDLVPGLVERAMPTRLVRGRDDEFQRVEFARRYVEQVPGADLVEVAGRHIPTEDSPREVAAAVLEHLRG